jgi:hypothetical protein
MPKTVHKEFLVYSFEELTQESKDRAFSDYIDFIVEVTSYEDGSVNFRKACDAAEEMRTPWFVKSYILDYCSEEILEDLSECYFHKDGEFYERIGGKGKVCTKM